MIDRYSVRVPDICGAGLSLYAVRQLLNRPYPLPYAKEAPGLKGGNRARVYRLDEVLTRLRLRNNFDEKMMVQIMAASVARQKELEDGI